MKRRFLMFKAKVPEEEAARIARKLLRRLSSQKQPARQTK